MSLNVIYSKYKKLYEACKKNPKIQLTARGKAYNIDDNSEYVVNKFAENGFVEKFAISQEDAKEVRKLRLEKNNNL